MSFKEYTALPFGELHDMIIGYQILNGITEEEPEEMYIPSLK